MTEVAVLNRAQDVCGRCDEGQWHGRACKYCGGSGRRWADPIGEAVADLARELEALARCANLIAGKTTLVMGAADRWRGRQSALQGTCGVTACGRVVTGVGEDRIKGGYCPRCYLHFCSWKLINRPSGDPAADRAAFVVYMATWIANKAERDRARREVAATIWARARAR